MADEIHNARPTRLEPTCYSRCSPELLLKPPAYWQLHTCAVLHGLPHADLLLRLTAAELTMSSFESCLLLAPFENPGVECMLVQYMQLLMVQRAWLMGAHSLAKSRVVLRLGCLSQGWSCHP